jgi:transposase
MNLKRRVRRKDGKEHVYYTLMESLRVSRRRVVQRTVLHLGELNTTQIERWQRTIEVIEEDGQRKQLRLFTDREGRAPAEEDVAEVRLSTMSVRRPRRFGDCWAVCRLWSELGLDRFWEDALGKKAGAVPWEKVVELLAVNRVCAPRSELSIHEKWFPQTAMDLLLGTGEEVADKDRLYRALDRVLEHKDGLEKHLADRWKDLFNAEYELLLYDLTSTYFEGQMGLVPKAKRGYSRDKRPDCKQLVIALIVTPEGFPLSYEVFSGNRADVTTLSDILGVVEGKYGHAKRVWVFDRGVVSEENLKVLRERGGEYLVGTPKSKLSRYEQSLLNGSWQAISEEVEVQLLPEDEDLYVLCRSRDRAAKEQAMRFGQVRGLMRDIIRLRRAVRTGTLKDQAKLQQRLGRLQERYPRAWRYIMVKVEGLRIEREWDRDKLKSAALRDGAYLLRAHLAEKDPARLWETYIQLTEVEAAFRVLKSEVKLRPFWHWLEHRVEAHVLVAFLGYCLWVCLKHRLRAVAPSLTPWQLLDQFGRIYLVEVWFQLRDGRWLCLPRITHPEPAQVALLHQLGWTLPEQPPPRICASDIPQSASQIELNVWPT